MTRSPERCGTEENALFRPLGLVRKESRVVCTRGEGWLRFCFPAPPLRSPVRVTPADGPACLLRGLGVCIRGDGYGTARCVRPSGRGGRGPAGERGLPSRRPGSHWVASRFSQTQMQIRVRVSPPCLQGSGSHHCAVAHCV